MQLVIAEKPSVARDLARVLGIRGTGRHALTDARRTITWCIGHLVELEEPAAYDPRWKSWRFDTLPMIPGAFKLRPVPGTRDQFQAVCELLRDRRFTEVVNGCDAGREGELIFRYVYELAGSRLPVRRLWISSLTDEAIRQGFAALRPADEYQGLGDAARCRSEADWLVGMNATRAVTLGFRAAEGGSAARPTTSRSQKSPLPSVYSIGRVQTPTLAIIVRREQAIRAFQPRDYWEVRGTFASIVDSGQTFTALWTLRSEKDKPVTRLGVRGVADQIVARARAHAAASDPLGPVVETLDQKRSREPPPQLFDLTSLQRTANRRYGFSATRTLEAAQALYERHKVLTYPRTDSRHLPLDQAGELPKLFRAMAKIPAYAPFAQPLIDGPPAPAARARRVFDDAKVHDHHAIIPTGKVPGDGSLGPDEQRIFDLVVRRFLGAFHPDAEFALTEAVIRVGDATNASAVKSPAVADTSDEPMLTTEPALPDRFVARGRVRLVAGWQDVAGLDDRRGGARDTKRPEGDEAGGKDKDKDSDATLPPLTKGQRLDGRFEPVAHQTRPPPRHTEATLLGAMESAGREIEDEELRAAMKDTGLGTPATRASTIETLVHRKFIAREGKQIVPTPTGIGLIERLPVPTLASPELTGAWESRLARIARGQETRAAFMTDIGRYVGEVTAAIRNGGRGSSPGGHDRTAAAPTARPTPPPPPSASAALLSLTCPRCQQGKLMTGKRGWGCSRWREDCSFVIWFEIAGKRITDAQLRDLVEKGKTRKGKWPRPGQAEAVGRLVLDASAAREGGAAYFQPA